MSEPLSLFSRRRNTTRLVFLVIIVATLPCYCLGAILLATAPDDSRPRTQQDEIATLAGRTATPLPSVSPTLTPFRSPTPRTGVGPTPSQFWLPTNTPYVWATWTPAATWTSFPTFTMAPTLTQVPTNTSIPTATLAPTDIPVPTNTLAPTLPPEPTTAPLPTSEPLPTQEPAPTQETGGLSGAPSEGT